MDGKRSRSSVCCSASLNKEKVKDESLDKPNSLAREIRKRYGELAKDQGESCCGTSSCTSHAGYDEEQLRPLPDKAVAASAGCGNPVALAELKDGEVVLDLGSGGGIDVFLAAQKVGPTGKAIGVDMTPEMIDLARENSRQSGLKNVEFRLGEIEHLPVANESVDVVISNCVINLSTDKDQVFREAYRVLRKDGRMLVSDIMADGLPDEVRGNFSTWAQCVGGAIGLEEYLRKIRVAGFAKVEVVSSSEYSKELVKDSIMMSEPKAGSAESADLLKKLEGARFSHAEIRARKI